jgi:hypothetical protein
MLCVLEEKNRRVKCFQEDIVCRGIVESGQPFTSWYNGVGILFSLTSVVYHQEFIRRYDDRLNKSLCTHLLSFSGRLNILRARIEGCA